MQTYILSYQLTGYVVINLNYQVPRPEFIALNEDFARPNQGEGA